MKQNNSGSKKSPFSNIMAKGQKKARYRPTNARLLMTMTDDNHKLIAALIKKWLNERPHSSTVPRNNSHNAK